LREKLWVINLIDIDAEDEELHAFMYIYESILSDDVKNKYASNLSKLDRDALDEQLASLYEKCSSALHINDERDQALEIGIYAKEEENSDG